MAERLIRMRELPTIVGISRSSIYTAMGEGKFPKPIPILGSPHRLGWPESKIEEFVQDQIRASRSE